jgi:hypothetical protein
MQGYAKTEIFPPFKPFVSDILSDKKLTNTLWDLRFENQNLVSNQIWAQKENKHSSLL